MPPAARLTDMHTCPMVTGVVPHVGGPIIAPCLPTVLIGGLPAARVTDMLVCVGPPDVIVKGSAGVFIGKLPAARIGDLTAHGGVIVVGLPTVIIGEVGSGPGGGGGGMGMGGAVGLGGAAAGGAIDAGDAFGEDAKPSTAGSDATSSSSSLIPSNIKIDDSDPDFAKETREALNRFAATPTGKSVLSSIGSSGKTVKITKMTGSNGGNTPDSLSDANLKPDGTPGPGSNTTVKFNPAFRPDGLPNTVVLGHELIHADHTTHGTRDPRVDPSGVRNEELKTVGLPPFPADGQTENNLRKDLGLPPRTSY